MILNSISKSPVTAGALDNQQRVKRCAKAIHFYLRVKDLPPGWEDENPHDEIPGTFCLGGSGLWVIVSHSFPVALLAQAENAGLVLMNPALTPARAARRSCTRP